MIVNRVDCGASHPVAKPVTGQQVGSQHMEGREMVIWARGSIERKQTVSFRAIAWTGYGGAAAMTSQAAKYLVKQLEELASNGSLMPVYIQWNATADPNALYNASELHDGWYIIEDLSPDYGSNIVTAIVLCSMTVTQIASKLPNRLGLSYLGGARQSNYLGVGTPLLSLPVSSTPVDTASGRFTAEGVAPAIAVTAVNPASSPEWFVPGATTADLFKGGVHIYDTINTSSNPVPLTGAAVHANWLEVFYLDHDFTGDCVITNGLHLLLFQIGVAGQVAKLYLYSTGLSPVGWQAWANLGSAGVSVLQQWSLTLVAPDECALDATCSGGGLGASALLHFRLLRGAYEFWVDLIPQSTALAATNTLELVLPVTPKIFFNELHAMDPNLDLGDMGVTANYGYGGAFIASASYPFLCGFLYQNQPGQGQLARFDGTAIQLGDTVGLAIGAVRSYGVFCVPYGVTGAGAYSPGNLQIEAENGALGSGWTSVADAGTSGGNAAKCVATTPTNRADAFNLGFTGPAGQYMAYFRARVLSSASVTPEMTLGLYNSGGSVFLASTTFAPSALPNVVVDTVNESIVTTVSPVAIPVGIICSFKPAVAGTPGTLRNAGPVVIGAPGTVTPTYGAATVANKLLVCCIIAPDGTGAITTGAAGWVQALLVNSGGPGPCVAIWYKLVSGVAEAAPTFTAGVGVLPLKAQLTQWNGILAAGALDQTGTFSPVPSSISPQGVFTMGAQDAATAELVITCTAWPLASSAPATFTDSANSGYLPVNAGNTGATSTGCHFNSTYGFTTTAYQWLAVGPATVDGVTPIKLRAVTAGTLATDWYIDQGVIVPVSQANFAGTWPQDIWQQWLFDRSTKMVRG